MEFFIPHFHNFPFLFGWQKKKRKNFLTKKIFQFKVSRVSEIERVVKCNWVIFFQLVEKVFNFFWENPKMFPEGFLALLNMTGFSPCTKKEYSKKCLHINCSCADDNLMNSLFISSANTQAGRLADRMDEICFYCLAVVAHRNYSIPFHPNTEKKNILSFVMPNKNWKR